MQQVEVEIFRMPSHNRAYSNKFLEDDSHSRAEKGRCVSSGCVGGMNGNLYIRPNLDTLRQAKAIKRLKYALVVFGGGVRFTVIQRSPEYLPGVRMDEPEPARVRIHP